MIVDVSKGIMCGGFLYRTDFTEEGARRLMANSNNGECDCLNKVITVNVHESEPQISETFIHEVIEAVNHVYCNDKIEHERIVQLAFGIHQALESLGVRFGRVA